VAAQLGLTGVVIAAVVPGSPAEAAGLRGIDTRSGSIGDVITAANGKPVHRLTDLTDDLEKSGVGGKIDVEIMRDGSRRTVELRVVDIATQ